MNTMYQALHDAQGVWIYEHFAAVWHGGVTVNIYSLDWEAIDCFTVADGSDRDHIAEKVEAYYNNGTEQPALPAYR